MGSHNYEMSAAWWRLYRTPSGVFFEVAAGYDGVIEGFEPLTDQQARRFREVNANSLVERYFGAMLQANRSLFSRRSVIAAIDVLEVKLTQAEISSLFTNFGPNFYEHLPNGGSAKSRMVDLKLQNGRHGTSSSSGSCRLMKAIFWLGRLNKIGKFS